MHEPLHPSDSIKCEPIQFEKSGKQCKQFISYLKIITFSICTLISVSDIGSAGDTSKIKLEASSESGFGTAVSDEAVI